MNWPRASRLWSTSPSSSDGGVVRSWRKINGAHPRARAGWDSAGRFQDRSPPARRAASDWVAPAACQAARSGLVSPASMRRRCARLGPEGRGAVNIVGVGTRISGSAEAAGIKLMDARAAVTALPRLAVHLAADAARSPLGQFAATRRPCRPRGREARERNCECGTAAGRGSSGSMRAMLPSAMRPWRRRRPRAGASGNSSCPNSSTGRACFIVRVDQQAQRRKFRESVVEAGFQTRSRSCVWR